MKKIEVLIEHEKIIGKVKELAKKIVDEYKDREELYFVTVLIGAKTFADDLIKEILKLKEFRINNNFVRLSSYGSGTESSGQVKVVKDIENNFKDKDLIIIEDIVDTGLTLNFLKNHLLKERKAHSVEVAALLDKPLRRKVDVKIDYLGFTVPGKFIVGYGIDFNEQYRELDYIGVLVED